jgi:hypothetical protein
VVSRWRLLASRHLYLSLLFPCHFGCSLLHLVHTITHVAAVCAVVVALTAFWLGNSSSLSIPSLLRIIVTFVSLTIPLIYDAIFWVVTVRSKEVILMDLRNAEDVMYATDNNGAVDRLDPAAVDELDVPPNQHKHQVPDDLAVRWDEAEDTLFDELRSASRATPIEQISLDAFIDDPSAFEQYQWAETTDIVDGSDGNDEERTSTTKTSKQHGHPRALPLSYAVTQRVAPLQRAAILSSVGIAVGLFLLTFFASVRLEASDHEDLIVATCFDVTSDSVSFPLLGITLVLDFLLQIGTVVSLCAYCYIVSDDEERSASSAAFEKLPQHPLVGEQTLLM